MAVFPTLQNWEKGWRGGNVTCPGVTTALWGKAEGLYGSYCREATPPRGWVSQPRGAV